MSLAYYDLGSFHRPINTRSAEAQIWFDRGLVWCYAFNHEESAKCFEQAIAVDPKCAIAYWGVAFARGPNYNKPWTVFDARDRDLTLDRARRAIAQARECASSAAPVESALVDTLQYRYPSDPESQDGQAWNEEYAKAMGAVYRRFPDDLDVATLYADALMNITPWDLWDLSSGRPNPNARTLEAKDVLDRALRQASAGTHPGLLHLYIHLMEMSSTPELALQPADRLRGLVPDAGHLHHMPTHLDVLCGDYRRAIASNSEAIRADEKFLARSGPLNFYTLYRAHNHHFRIYAALFAGQSKVALDTVGELEAAIPEELLRVESPPMADWLEGFLGMRVHALIRFGRWHDILDLQLPHDRDLYCVTTPMVHYAKGIALGSLGRIEEADRERTFFVAAVERTAPTRTLFNNKCREILAVAHAMLDGELEYRRGNVGAAFELLRRGIQLDHGLPYDEPWGWMQPVRHAYGALLLEQGAVDKAAAVYAADLGLDDTLPRPLQHPNNVWALHGYHECLTKLGRTAEACIIEKQLRLALATADVPIRSSCFCRMHTDIASDGCCDASVTESPIPLAHDRG
ncbi:hypothetical protein PHISP_03088 [Aspergillus sp. HF37]|nr:hypothetical protein PHISP_03088 [Aspergillus sp. HF37]